MTTFPGKKQTFRLSLEKSRTFVHSLSFMLEGGLRLEEALELMEQTETRPGEKYFLSALLLPLKEGEGFLQILGTLLPGADPVFLSLIRAGQASGDLKKSLGGLEDYLERKIKIRDSFRSAAAYPLFLLFVVFTGMSFFIRFVLPSLEELVNQLAPGGVSGSAGVLPDFNFMRRLGYMLILLFLFAAGIILVNRLRHFGLPNSLDHFFYRFFPESFRHRQYYILFLIIEILAGAGISLDKALELAAPSLRSRVLAAGLNNICVRLREGEPADRLFLAGGEFPPLVGRWIRYGLESGRAAEAVRGLRLHYERKMEAQTRLLIRWMEPAFILVSGLLLLLLVIRVVLPLFTLMGAGL